MPEHPNGPSPGGTPADGADRVLLACETLAARGGDTLAPLAEQLRQARLALGEPMRLAVAGQIKRGKSTLVNALLGEEVTATGQLELTFTISELRHGARRAVFVHQKDGTVRGPLPPASLSRLTVRNPALLRQLGEIRIVEYALPNELLRSFRLIDTPGLGSVHVTDAENTMDYLGISAAWARDEERAVLQDVLTAAGRSGGDVHRESMAEIKSADAVLYLFTRGMHERDLAAVSEFLGTAGAEVTPLRAFGVLSRCDEIWPPMDDLPGSPQPHEFDPMAAGTLIAKGYLNRPDIGRLFYTMVPVAGKIGIGARLLTAGHFGWLDELVKDARSPAALAQIVYDVNDFSNAERLEGVRLPQPARAELVRVLGGWGVFLAAKYRLEGATEREATDMLTAASGITRLRDLVISHFGNRAEGIKLSHGLQRVTAAVGKTRLRLQLADRQVPRAVAAIAGAMERLRNDDDSAAEFGALAAYYNGKVAFSEAEAAELLTVTGEHGTTSAARLGLPENAPRAELRAVAGQRAAGWAEREQDPVLDVDTASAAAVVQRCYERILQAVTAPELATEHADGGAR